MKNIFKVALIAILLISTTAFSQDFQGKAFYQTKTTIDFNFDDSRIPPDRKERMKEMMKQQGEKVYELSFTSSESIYKEEEQLDQPGNTNTRGPRFLGGLSSGTIYKNTKTKEFTQEKDLMGKEFLIVDDLEVLNWEMQDESKMIGQYLCFKATALKTVDVSNVRFGPPPRNNDTNKKEEEKETTKEIEIVAWYTVDVPVNQGPGKYWGLPGLILEINAGNVQIVCTKIVINPKDKITIKPLTKGKVVTEEKYNKIQADKIKEMREMYGGQRRGGGGPGGPRG